MGLDDGGVEAGGLGGDVGPGDGLAPWGGGGEIWSDGEGGLEGGEEAGVEGGEAKDARAGLREVDSVQAAWDEDGDAEGAGEGGGAGGEDGAVVEEDAIRGGEPALEGVIGLPCEVEADVFGIGGMGADGGGVGRGEGFAGDGEGGGGLCGAPPIEDRLDALVGLDRAEHEAEGLGHGEAEGSAGLPARGEGAEGGGEIAVWDDVEFIRADGGGEKRGGLGGVDDDGAGGGVGALEVCVQQGFADAVVRAEVVGGEDDGEAAGGEGEVEGVADLAPEIEAIVAALEEFLWPMDVDEVAGPALDAAREGKETAVADGEGDLDSLRGEGAGEEGLVCNALPVIGGEEDLHLRSSFFMRAMPSE